MADTKLVNITKAFTLTVLREGEQVALKIAAGIQRLEKDVADHWYTKAHSDDVPKGVTQSDAEAQAEADDAELDRMEAEQQAGDDAAGKGGKAKKKA